MVHGKLSHLFGAVVLVVGLAVLGGNARADDSLESLLKQTDYPYKATDPNTFVVSVSSGNRSYNINVWSEDAPWKNPDKSAVGVVHMQFQMTPAYPTSTAPPPELTRAIAEATANTNYVCYGLIVAEQQKLWAVSSKTCFFSAGLNKDTLGYYLELMGIATAAKQDSFTGMMADQADK